MSTNANNYLGHNLQWTEYNGKKDRENLPLNVPLVFRNKETGEIGFGRANKTSNSVMLILDGHFDFDMKHILEHSEWASLEFVFRDYD